MKQKELYRQKRISNRKNKGDEIAKWGIFVQNAIRVFYDKHPFLSRSLIISDFSVRISKCKKGKRNNCKQFMYRLVNRDFTVYGKPVYKPFKNFTHSILKAMYNKISNDKALIQYLTHVEKGEINEIDLFTKIALKDYDGFYDMLIKSSFDIHYFISAFEQHNKVITHNLYKIYYERSTNGQQKSTYPSRILKNEKKGNAAKFAKNS